ncbi:hypothetical protein JCM14036_12660 [Desulfotomaculum defluvii]
MRIKSIQMVRNTVFGDIFLDFTDGNNNIIDTIIFAGENGCGKTTLFNYIFDFSLGDFYHKPLSIEKRIYTIRFSDNEIETLKSLPLTNDALSKGVKDNEFTFTFDFSLKDWQKLKVSFLNENNEPKEIHSNHVSNDAVFKEVLKVIYSDAEISFNPSNINYVTSKEIDQKIVTSVRSSKNLATEITQLLIDIQASDDADFSSWAKENIGQPIDEQKIDVRMKRFKNAFDFMFEHKTYKKIINENNEKKVLFEENDRLMTIDLLSSGEKQIVFRGSFLLKDKNSTTGAVVLLDEPEISLHPTWQIKILEFIKRLFQDENGNQTSQLFIATHSPFILHNQNRTNDKVIIFKKDRLGNITLPDTPKFFGWSPEKEIEHAFNLSFMPLDSSIPLIITEGKTDWKHLKTAYCYFKSIGEFTTLELNFLEYEDNVKMGEDELKKMCAQFSKVNHTNKLIMIFDRDIPKTVEEVKSKDMDYKYWGNNVYSFPIPIPKHRKENPDVSIEFYYLDDDIKRYDEGRRLFVSNEFNNVTGRHQSLDLVCTDGKFRNNRITIIDNCVFDSYNVNVALSKNNFAENISKRSTGFENVDFTEFRKIFLLIEEIVNL